MSNSFGNLRTDFLSYYIYHSNVIEQSLKKKLSLEIVGNIFLAHTGIGLQQRNLHVLLQK